VTAYLYIKVSPNGDKDSIHGHGLDAKGKSYLCVKIHEPPMDNLANEGIIKFFSKVLNVPKSKISILLGHKNRLKLIQIEGLEQVNVDSVIKISMAKDIH